MKTIQIPFNFCPRKYQIGLYNSIANGYKRAVAVWHRRAGKDKTLINIVCKEALKRKGSYYYFFPSYNQGRKIIWEGMDRSGFKFLDHIPVEIREKTNDQEMRIKLKNGSIIQIVGSDTIDSIVGSNPIGCVFSEYALQKPEAWTFIRPILAENGGWAIFQSTPRGLNHFHDIYQTAEKNKDWFCELLTIADTGVLTEADIQKERDEGMSEALIRQEYYCFTPDTDVICIDEVKFIKDILVGDFVLTHGNRYRAVKGISCRKYIGKLIKIKTIGNRKDIICTPEHNLRVCNDGINNKWIEAQNLTLKDRITFPKILKKKHKIVSKTVLTLLAWYITEGSCSKSMVQYTLNENEIEYHGQIKSSAKAAGYNYSVAHNKQNHTITICVNSVELVEFLIRNCGSGAANKRIPFDLIAGHEELFYKILINGDGHRYYKKGVYTKDMYATVSKTLAYQVQLLAHQLGYGCGICIVPARTEIIRGKEVECKIKYDINIYTKEQDKRHSAYYNRHKYNVTAPIRSIDYIDYDGCIYNLDVMYDSSYTANGRVVHNCDFSASAENVLIPLDIVLKASKTKLKASEYSFAPIVIGVDVARFGDDQSVIYVRQGLCTQEIIKYRNLDLMTFVSRIVAVADKYKPACVYVDSVGIGAGVVDRLQSLNIMSVVAVNGGASPIQPKYKNKRAELWCLMLDWLKAGGSIPNDRDLMTELSSVEYSFDIADRLQLEKKSDMKKRGINSPDISDALSYSFGGQGGVLDNCQYMDYPT